MDIIGLKKAVPFAFQSNQCMVLVGPHGEGKSQGVRQAVEGQDLGKVWDCRIGQMADVGDLVGIPDIVNSENYCQFKIPKRFYDVIEYCNANPDKYGVIFFDEVNRTTDKGILQGLFEIILDGTMNGTVFPSNMRCIAAMNPATDDYTVFDFDDKAFNDRFLFVRFEVSNKVWLKYAKEQNVCPSIVSFLRENEQFISKAPKEFELPAEFSKRTWFAVDRLKKVTGGLTDTFQEMLMGMVGTEAAASYVNHCKTFVETINASDILNKYKSIKEIVLQYANPENDRTDVINKATEDLLDFIGKMEKGFNKTQEKNFSEFVCDLPGEVGSAFVTKCWHEKAFIHTTSDKETGMASGNFPASVALIEKFSGWRKDLQLDEKKEETTEVNEDA
jgi:hypothetical protein